uniref:Uncharacterized protein n=1 Tax=Cucumis melo TaxID=3656 RepID=A0A9I9CCM3_CUCME
KGKNSLESLKIGAPELERGDRKSPLIQSFKKVAFSWREKTARTHLNRNPSHQRLFVSV